MYFSSSKKFKHTFARPCLGQIIHHRILTSESFFCLQADVFWYPPQFTVSSDNNVFQTPSSSTGVLFPNGTSLKQWVTMSKNDNNSVVADPLLADPAAGDFTVLPASPAWALGWQAIDLSTVGPLPT